MTDREPLTSSLYYSQFAGDVFVIQAEIEAVEDTPATLAILQGIHDLIRHGIHVVLVFAKGARFEEELRTRFDAYRQPETNHLIVPEKALPGMQQQRHRVAQSLARACQDIGVPCSVVPESVVHAERRIAHASTGIATGFDGPAIQAILSQRQLAIVGFGGQDDQHRFLHVPSVSLAADMAVGLRAQKLLCLTRSGGICVPNKKGDRRQLSFADLEELLRLMQATDAHGQLVLTGAIVPKVHASIRAVAGGVQQVHIVSSTQLLDEILTRTGVGTMIERHQSHHVDFARAQDLDAVQRLHIESQQVATPLGTAYVKPRDRSELQQLLPRTLLLKHRDIIVGKLHATPIPGEGDVLLIGGFVIAENHQDSQHGQLLLTETLSRLREKNHSAAAAITASERAKRLFLQNGATRWTDGSEPARLLERARRRYHDHERDLLQLFHWPGCASSAGAAAESTKR